ncbi:dihydropteroate synthase [Thiomicrorhabdus aquaedulcis]|uniref:dihydropteroate synthase n=1 Tax=Thiomicrorhabdus aquaedulcis TaxID=2211106 RepID=UPI000FDB100C|nr:dihydropteroate synthase [Thiomicrorhabdus aquaedulcis]
MSIVALINQKFADEHGAPLVMGIFNATPDSFSDGGKFTVQNKMQAQVEAMIKDGADIIDVGGESTRPGAQPVSVQEELDRVMPVIEFITANFDVPVSVDTYKTAVMRAAIAAGSKIVNDVNALQDLGAAELVAQTGVSVCLMHKQGGFTDMQNKPQYHNVVDDVTEFLLKRAKACEHAGINADNIVLDPGYGFGKTLEHNLALFEHLDHFVNLPYPVLVGVSRKSMIGQLLGDVPVEDRMVGSVAAAMLATLKGAKILRVHDVKPTVEALRVTLALL